MVKIETRKNYLVKHKTKGNFVLAVQFTDENFTTGKVIAGKVEAVEAENEIATGGQVTVRNSFCEFGEIKEPVSDGENTFTHFGEKKGKEL